MESELMPQPINPESEKKIFNFILRLAADPFDSNDTEIIEAIVTQLKSINTSPNLPDIITILDPEANHSETKLLSEKAKERLTKALDTFVSLYSK
jgi:hypothetical protein